MGLWTSTALQALHGTWASTGSTRGGTASTGSRRELGPCGPLQLYEHEALDTSDILRKASEPYKNPDEHPYIFGRPPPSVRR